MNKTIHSTCLTLGGLLLIASSANAADVISPLEGAPGWQTLLRDNSTGSIQATPTNDGDGSLVQSTPNNLKSLAFYTNSGTLPTLGDLKNGSLTFDYLKDSSSTATQHMAIKLFLENNANGIDVNGAQLSWETDYNAVTLATGTWNDDIDAGSGNWWLRSGGFNYNEGGDAHSLSFWAANGSETSSGNTSITLSDSTPILGYGFQVGSGWSGTFTSAVDDLNVTYTGASSNLSYAGNFQAVPEPGTMAVLGGALVAFLRRRRKQS